MTLRAEGRNQSLAQQVASLVSRSDFTLIGEYHDVRNMQATIANPSFVEGLARGGVRHIALELDRRDQHLVDSYMSGKIDANQFASGMAGRNISILPGKDGDGYEYLRTVVQVMELSKANGIKVHFVDNKFATMDSNRVTDIIDRIEKTNPGAKERWLAHLKENGSPDSCRITDTARGCNVLQNFINDEISRIQNPKTRATLSQNIESIILNNRTADSSFSDYMLQRIPAGERVLGYFGIYHLNNHDNRARVDIDDRLQDAGRTVTTIYLTDGQTNINDGRDRPDYILNVTNNRITQTTSRKDFAENTNKIDWDDAVQTHYDPEKLAALRGSLPQEFGSAATPKMPQIKIVPMPQQELTV